MHAAHEQSFAKVKFNEMDAVKRAGDRHRRNMDLLDYALASGLQFKFRSDGMAILEDDPEFHLIAQQPMTRETYMRSSPPASTTKVECHTDRLKRQSASVRQTMKQTPQAAKRHCQLR